MADGPSEDGTAPALEGARRVYDRQITKLESIDDKAMRTARTAVLILGFIAAALTTAGPGVLSDVSGLTASLGVIGAVSVFASAFLSVGVYTVTEYPVEIREGDLRAANRVTNEEWRWVAIDRLDEASTEIEPEIEVNAEYLEQSQFLLLLGVFLLSYATGITVVARSYGIAPWEQTVVVGIIAAILLVVRVITRGSQETST